MQVHLHSFSRYEEYFFLFLSRGILNARCKTKTTPKDNSTGPVVEVSYDVTYKPAVPVLTEEDTTGTVGMTTDIAGA